MSDSNQQRNKNPLQDERTGQDRDRQEPATGKEPAQNFENTVAETQRGKIKDDGDPSLESDQPIEQGRRSG